MRELPANFIDNRVQPEQNDPVCPRCGETMVRALEQDEEGNWGIVWLCGCVPTESEIREAENEA